MNRRSTSGSRGRRSAPSLPCSTILAVALLAAGCRPAGDGRVHITYWEKWAGAEAAAMQAVVDQFNRSQDRIAVEFLSTANVDRKTIVATAGGDPPDVVGLWPANLYAFADRDALQPLDDLIRATGATPAQWQARYEPVYADIGTYRGRIWGVPTAAAATALHWNKALFREAGLDPERPPRTLAELDEFAEKLTRRDPPTGRIIQLGFLPQEPGWFAWAFPAWFGGGYVDHDTISIGTRPENLAAYQWVAGYTRRYGLDQVRTFTGGFGNFSSPQNPFFSGRIAMVLQGVWMNNFSRQFAPGLEYGVAPWPATGPGRDGFTVAECDLLSIPNGATHPREAWEFIRFASSINPRAQRREDLVGLELVCYLQQKNSPLREWSPYFEQHHPHPYIGLFRDLARSPQAIHLPKLGIWQEYRRELDAAFEAVRLLAESPEQAVAFCQQRIANSWQWHQRSLARRRAVTPPAAELDPPRPSPSARADDGGGPPASTALRAGTAGRLFRPDEGGAWRPVVPTVCAPDHGNRRRTSAAGDDGRIPLLRRGAPPVRRSLGEGGSPTRGGEGEPAPAALPATINHQPSTIPAP